MRDNKPVNDEAASLIAPMTMFPIPALLLIHKYELSHGTASYKHKLLVKEQSDLSKMVRLLTTAPLNIDAICEQPARIVTDIVKAWRQHT